jgi:hypothetical protein
MGWRVWDPSRSTPTPRGGVTSVAMCRSIKTLREPYTEHVTDADVRAAALQYVRKISGFRAPASHNAPAFDHAVATIAAATQELLDQLEVRGQPSASRAAS